MMFVKNNLVQLALTISLISTLGSIYFSKFLNLPPCELCWYQRIFMFPLVVIFAVGIWKKDKNISYFSIPLIVGGLFIAIYHNLLYYGFIPENLTPCTTGISCTEKQLEILGFITIPLLSLASFATLLIIMLFYKTLSSKN